MRARIRLRAHGDGLCVRVSSAADFELDWNEVGGDVSVLNISTEATRHFPWWDMRNACWRGELKGKSPPTMPHDSNDLI